MRCTLQHPKDTGNSTGSGGSRVMTECRHRLTKAQLAHPLRLGGNTISRWESGRNVQTAAMDVLLRLIRDIPESLRYLKKHAA